MVSFKGLPIDEQMISEDSLQRNNLESINEIRDEDMEDDYWGNAAIIASKSSNAKSLQPQDLQSIQHFSYNVL